MRTVLTFRFTADVVSGSQQVKVSGEFSAPDGLHETVTIGANTVEVLRVGTRAFRRDTPTAAWRVVPAANASAPTDPRSAFSVLAGVTDVRLQGSSYAFTLGKPAAASLVAGSTSVTGSGIVERRPDRRPELPGREPGGDGPPHLRRVQHHPGRRRAGGSVASRTGSSSGRRSRRTCSRRRRSRARHRAASRSHARASRRA